MLHRFTVRLNSVFASGLTLASLSGLDRFLHSAIGNLDCKTFNQNNEFIELLDSMDENIENLIKDNILDPFSDNFANLIPVAERYKHTYITGMTGSGKSELLKVLIMGDILRENGSIILLEPHGDLAQSVTKLVKDKSRLVYITQLSHIVNHKFLYKKASLSSINRHFLI